MKILISNDGPGAHFFIRLGLARAFVACGHEAILWDIRKKPVLDAFDEFEPDIFLGQTYNTNRVLAKAIHERPHMKVIMKASDWGPLTNKLDSQKYPVLKVNDREKKTILELYEKTQKPDYLHIYYPDEYLSETSGDWIKAGIPVYSQLNAADIFDYTGGKYMKEFDSDITFVGGYWPYKAQVLDKFLLPLTKERAVRIKIFGGTPWPTKSYYGPIEDKYVKHAFASAKVCPHLHEPHSQDFGYDISERPFKLLSNKCFVVSDYVEGLTKLFNNEEIIFTKTPEEFKENCYHFIKYPNERLPYIKRGYDKVISKHTYFNRVIDIFNRLGILDEVTCATKTFEEIKKKISL